MGSVENHRARCHYRPGGTAYGSTCKVHELTVVTFDKASPTALHETVRRTRIADAYPRRVGTVSAIGLPGGAVATIPIAIATGIRNGAAILALCGTAERGTGSGVRSLLPLVAPGVPPVAAIAAIAVSRSATAHSYAGLKQQ